MAYKLEMNHPDFPKDTVFDIGGVAVKNGSSVTISKEDEARILARTGAETLKDAISNTEHLKISGSKEGGDS